MSPVVSGDKTLANWTPSTEPAIIHCESHNFEFTNIFRRSNRFIGVACRQRSDFSFNQLIGGLHVYRNSGQ